MPFTKNIFRQEEALGLLTTLEQLHKSREKFISLGDRHPHTPQTYEYNQGENSVLFDVWIDQ